MTLIAMSRFYKAREQKVHGRFDYPGQLSHLFPLVRLSLPFLLCTVTGLSAGELGDPKKLPPTAASFNFAQDVRTVFETACVHCHNAEKDKGGLRLDTRELALKGGDEHKAIVPGKSADSALVHFAARLVDEMEMPPKGKGDALTPEQIGKLRAWIDAGAPWPEGLTLKPQKKVEVAVHEKVPPTQDPAKLKHWAFRPPVRPPVPAGGNPIDAFIRVRLQKEGLAPSPEAGSETLCRRLYLDLVGLPPKPEEVDAFVMAYQANADGAIATLADQLLASPHYGERWGRHWLDAARYADSDGYEKDKPRIAHFYRDWVIGAFNRDLPYDQFVIEQLAGDQLPSPTQDQIVATGFLRNSLLNEEGGVDPEQFRMEAMFDRMDCIGKAVLGLTISCVQCHDHKFDPFTQEEYYKMFAFLNNDHEAQPRVWSTDDLRRRADVLRQIADEEKKLQHDTSDWAGKMAAWEEAWRTSAQAEWKMIGDLEWDQNGSGGGMRYLAQKDASWLAAGFQPTKSDALFHWKIPVDGVTGFRLENLHDADLPGSGPGRSFLGTFGLSEFKVDVRDGATKGQKVKWAKATADLAPRPETPVHLNFNEKTPKRRVIGPASYAIDGNDDTGWASDLGPGRRNEESTAVFAAEKPFTQGQGVTFVLGQKIGGWNADDLHANALGRFRLSYTTSVNPEANPVPPRVRAALNVRRENRSPAHTATIFSYWRTTVPEWKEANERIEKLWAQHPEGSTQFTLAPLAEPRMTTILKRGDWLKPDRAVQPGVLKVLNPLPAGAPPNRLTFARFCALAGGSPIAHDGPSAGESRLANVLRHGATHLK
jgi:mono/diheme cytochrome c family protein